MQVCIDIQAAISQRAGVGRYTHRLVHHLAGLQDPELHLRLAYFDFQRKGEPFPIPGADFSAVRWVPGRFVQKAWKTVGWPPFDFFSGPADVFHFPNFVRPPLRKGRSVVTIHDVSFLRFPETMEPKNFAFFDRHMRRTVEAADAIITDCRFVADELQDLFDVPEEKLHPVLLGVDPPVADAGPEAVADLRRRHDLQRPYLLHVGTLEPRKNHRLLVEVFDRLEHFDGDLVLAGMTGWRTEPILERIAASPRRDRIRRLDFVPDEDLPALYAGAEAFVFPSLYEGFGFPPLEAMQQGTPVISSTAGSLAEVLGEGAELVDHYDPDGWAQVVGGVLDDAPLQADLIQRGHARVAEYDWARTARETRDVYRQVGA